MFTLLMLGSGVPSGGSLKLTGSSSVDRCEGRRTGLSGLLQGVVIVGDSGAGWSFTSGFLGEGSRAVGDNARLACTGEKKVLKLGDSNLFNALCSNETL